MERKPIQVKNRTHEILRLEAARRSMKPNTVMTMGGLLDEFAEKLNKKHNLLRGQNNKYKDVS